MSGFHNQMMDPEGSPVKPSGLGFSGAPIDDPWYSGSAQESPTSSDNNRSSFNYNNYNNGMMSGGGSVNSALAAEPDYDNEPPLLEELGINFDHIWAKTQAVLIPTKQINAHILDDSDLAGPLCFCLLLGSCLLLSGKVQFGYIYGFSVFGCLALQGILSLIHPVGLDFWRTCSVLGYCLLPVIGLAALGILLSLKGVLGLVLSAIVIAWSTFAATRLIDAKLSLTELYW
eukprot:CAMPEP_0170390184 /NCGR_PEP_ID=MMETSP0117_2-20130122/19009_1 /TAXON_ID=400756 /ORGANISM="Durinskia baltica, Strain CSIRO CS-38" /LENGTH=229 /DNA_ID=CAMNT_0010646209 /DNA_START=28 /DNA_END=714 /DNA_ORIENTATION=-